MHLFGQMTATEKHVICAPRTGRGRVSVDWPLCILHKDTTTISDSDLDLDNLSLVTFTIPDRNGEEE